jgi:hypothetical protein
LAIPRRSIVSQIFHAFPKKWVISTLPFRYVPVWTDTMIFNEPPSIGRGVKTVVRNRGLTSVEEFDQPSKPTAQTRRSTLCAIRVLLKYRCLPEGTVP